MVMTICCGFECTGSAAQRAPLAASRTQLLTFNRASAAVLAQFSQKNMFSLGPPGPPLAPPGAPSEASFVHFRVGLYSWQTRITGRSCSTKHRDSIDFWGGSKEANADNRAYFSRKSIKYVNFTIHL